MSSDVVPVPIQSAEELQLSLAKVAFEVARVSSVLQDFVCPPNALLGAISPDEAKARLETSYQSMMKLAGELLGMSKE
ncbi:hypothetical protein M2305_000072 [Gluconobacter cerinus]|uniref:hypothetical protein n=1 Tax=Gluconobacter cerinus TaxID=38307 RepID=UPI0022269067|nr:hypothetical protein [Gluconobacter cerinus]MCW2264125.1 hypothetical protein [Gluconobacter cerinus]